MHSCQGSSLSKSCFDGQLSENISDNAGSVLVAYTEDNVHVEKEFSSISFQLSLFSIATNNCIRKLHTLN